MPSHALTALLQNAALLLAMAVVYDLATSRQPIGGRPLRQALAGAILGGIGIAIMQAPLSLEPGIVFDTRSVMLAVSGLFLGVIPVAVAMAMTALFRLAQGGTAATAGVLVILASGGIGIAWRRWRRTLLEDLSWRELYGFGVVVHLVMLAIMLTLPSATARRVIARIGPPVMLVHPIATAALGALLVNRLRRERTATQLAESESRYRSLFEDNHAAMLVVDPDGGAIMDANPAACCFYGWTREHLRSMRIDDIDALPPDVAPADEDRARAGEGGQFLFQHRRADGSVRDVEVLSGPVTIHGRLLRYSIVHDVTDRRRIRAALRESEERYEQLLRIAPVGIVVHSDGKIVFANPASAQLLGGDAPEQIIGKPVAEIVHPDALERLRERTRETLAGVSGLHPAEDVYLKVDGSPVNVEVMAAPLTYDGRPAMQIVLTDVGGRKRAEEALRQSEAQFRAMFETASIGMAQADVHTGRWLCANDKMSEITGYPVDELVGMRLSDITHPDDRERDWRAFERVVRGDAPDYRLEKRYLRKNGTLVWVSVNMTVVRDTDGQPVRTIATIEDVTERRRAEEETHRLLDAAEASRHALLSVIEDRALTEAKLRLQTSALEAAANAIIITERDGRIEWVNPAFTALTGYTNEESRGRDMRELMRSSEEDRALYSRLWEDIRAGRVWRGELACRRKDGSIYTEEQTITPVRGDDGGISHFIAVKEDITERKQAEAERQGLDAQLRQAQKMESVGRLAGGVAHDYNNALGVVLGHAELALNRLEPGNPVGRHLEAIREAALRSANLTRQLLAFARRQTIAPKVLDLNDAVTGMLNMLRHLIGESVHLSWTPGANLWPVKVDPTQVDQILANLLVNARDAIDGVGGVWVETRNVVLDEAFCSVRSGCVPGEYVALSVADDGCGMQREVLDRVFEPFFTTKAVGHGTGLGLATVYGIVKQNLGYIDVASVTGEGTTFDVYLPSMAGQVPQEAPAKDANVEPRGRGETVLLVEDEPAMLEVEAEMLGDLGYLVLKAGRPGRALNLAGAHPGSIHLLITDMVMPEMNGRDLAERLAAIRPGIRCLFVSGYTADVIAKRGVLDDGVRLLEKPFSRRDLAAKVREALDD